MRTSSLILFLITLCFTILAYSSEPRWLMVSIILSDKPHYIETNGQEYNLTITSNCSYPVNISITFLSQESISTVEQYQHKSIYVNNSACSNHTGMFVNAYNNHNCTVSMDYLYTLCQSSESVVAFIIFFAISLGGIFLVILIYLGQKLYRKYRNQEAYMTFP